MSRHSPIVPMVAVITSFCMTAIVLLNDPGQRQQFVPTGYEPVIQIGHTVDRSQGVHVRHVVFSPTGRRLITEGGGEIILWDVQTGDRLRSFPSGKGVLAPVFCRQGLSIATGNHVWDIHDGRLRCRLFDDDAKANRLRVSRDGRFLIAATWLGSVRVVDLTTGKTRVSWKLDQNALPADPANTLGSNWSLDDVAFDRQGEPLAVMHHSDEFDVLIWNISTNTKRAEFRPDSYGNLWFSPLAEYVVKRDWYDTGDHYDEVVVHDARNGRRLVQSEELSALNSDSGLASALLFTPDEKFCVTGSGERTVTVWNLQTGQAVRKFGEHQRGQVRFRLLDEGRIVETRSPGMARRWDLHTGELLRSFAPPEPAAEIDPWQRIRTRDIVVPDPSGQTYLVHNMLYEAQNGQLKHALHWPLPRMSRAHPYSWDTSVSGRVFSPTGETVVVRFGEAVVLFDVASGQPIRQLAKARLTYSALRWSPDGRRALTTADSAEFSGARPFRYGYHLLWDVKNGRLLQTIGMSAGKNSFISNPLVSFSPNGKFVYTHGERFGTFLWDAETGRPVNHEPPGADGVTSGLVDGGGTNEKFYHGRSLFSQDGCLVATQYVGTPTRERDTAWKVWNLETGRHVQTVADEKLDSALPGVSFTSTAPPRPWTRQEIPRRPTRSSSESSRAAFWHTHSPARWKESTADGKRLVHYHVSGDLAVWDVATEKLLFRYYLLDDGHHWLTWHASGRVFGHLDAVRFRRPGTIKLK